MSLREVAWCHKTSKWQIQVRANSITFPKLKLLSSQNLTKEWSKYLEEQSAENIMV